MRVNVTMFLNKKEEYCFNTIEDFMVLQDKKKIQSIFGNWDDFEVLFEVLDEGLHDERETNRALQERVLEAESKVDRLEDEKEELRDILNSYREKFGGSI